MQVLQWLFRAAQDQKPVNHHHHRDPNDKETKEPKVDEKSKEIVSYKKKRVSKRAQNSEAITLDCDKNFKYLALLFRGGNFSRAYFLSTLNQKIRPSNLKHKQQKHYYYYYCNMKMKKEDLVRGLGLNQKGDSSVVVGNKVLPISDSTSSSSSRTSNGDDQQHCRQLDQKIMEKVKGESNNSSRTKTLSRMKELLRWAANAKSSEKGGKFGKKVLHFRNRSATIKSGGFEDQLNNDSPKISFRWEVESCTTTCSAMSAPPSLKYDQRDHHSRPGSWITTDDEFVVLEL